MLVQHGTVTSFNPTRGWGFAKIDGTQKSVFIHKDRKSRIKWIGPEINDFEFTEDASCYAQIDDKLVFATVQNNKGMMAEGWAFKSEWDAVRKFAPVPAASVVEVTKVAEVAPIPKEDPPLTFEEMLEVLDFRFLHALLDAMEKGGEELTPLQLQEFVRNTPKGKKGEALWDDFHKRQAKSRDKTKYGIVTFIKQVLVDGGFIIDV